MVRNMGEGQERTTRNDGVDVVCRRVSGYTVEWNGKLWDSNEPRGTNDVGVVCHGVSGCMWYGMVWFGLVWYGMVQERTKRSE